MNMNDKIDLKEFNKVRKTLVDALMKNKKKATEQMRASGGGRCCLCVIQDTLCGTDKKLARDLTDLCEGDLHIDGPGYKLFGKSSFEVNVPFFNKELKTIKFRRVNAADLNDGDVGTHITPLSHKAIAGFVNVLGRKVEVFPGYYHIIKDDNVAGGYKSLYRNLEKPMTRKQILKHLNAKEVNV